MPLRLLVADDHPLIRAGIKAALSACNVDVVAELESGEGLLDLVGSSDCELVLLDVRLAPTSGFEALKALRLNHAKLPVVMFSAYDNPCFAAHAYHLGAAGFLSKQDSPVRFAEVLHSAATQQTAFTKEEVRKISSILSSRRFDENQDVSLTKREQEVLQLMAEGSSENKEGFTNKIIAQQMGISSETVKEHVQHILQKIGVNDRTQAVYWGLKNSVIKLREDTE